MAADLNISGLTAGYGREPVLRRLSCCFLPGCLSAILGVNGAGKSTLLRVLTGYIAPSSGSVMLGDKEILSLTPRERSKKLALVPQLTPEGIPLSVREAVSIALYPRLNGQSADEAARETCAAALTWMEIEVLADRRLDELSGGELRRVLIAQGLAQGADVLLLDEPTAFLDPPARYGILRLLRELARSRDMTIVAVLHDPALARQFADHVLLLRDGSALAEGDPRDILTDDNLLTLYGQSEPWWTTEEKCAT